MSSKNRQRGLLLGAVSSLAAICAITSTLRNPAPLVFSLLSTASGVFTYRDLKGSSVGELQQAALSLFSNGSGSLGSAFEVIRPQSVAEFLTSYKSGAGDPTTKGFWLPERSTTSSILVGGRGSGKSMLFAYLFQQSLTLKGVKSIFCDPHYDAVDKQGKPKGVDWLPGVGRDEVREYFAIEQSQLLEHLQRLQKQIERQQPVEQKQVLFIDEWDGLFSRWSEKQRKIALSAVQAILNEGRKFEIEILIAVHTLKQKITGLDSSFVAQADLYLMRGFGFSDRSEQLPTSIDRDNALSAHTEVSEGLSVSQRSVTYYDCDTQKTKVVVTPNLKTERVFKLAASDTDRWFESNQPLIDRMFEENASLTAISNALKLQRALNGPKRDERYVKLSAYLETLSA